MFIALASGAQFIDITYIFMQHYKWLILSFIFLLLLYTATMKVEGMSTLAHRSLKDTSPFHQLYIALEDVDTGICELDMIEGTL